MMGKTVSFQRGLGTHILCSTPVRLSRHLQMNSKKRTLGMGEFVFRFTGVKLGRLKGMKRGRNREPENGVFQKSPIFKRQIGAVRFLAFTSTSFAICAANRLRMAGHPERTKDGGA